MIHLTTVDPGLVETNFSRVRFRGDEEAAAKVYQGIDALTPDDIADCVLFAVTRPARERRRARRQGACTKQRSRILRGTQEP